MPVRESRPVADNTHSIRSQQRDDSALMSAPATAKFLPSSTPLASRTLPEATTRPREQTYDDGMLHDVVQAGHVEPHHERHDAIINPTQGSVIASAARFVPTSSSASSSSSEHTVAETLPLSTTQVEPHIQQVQSQLLLQSGPVGLDNGIVKEELSHLQDQGKISRQ
jgi:hypothetical protein